jgi:epoxyqueuosine reductase
VATDNDGVGGPAPVAATQPGAKYLAPRIRERARQLGFDDVGFASLGPSRHAAFYRAWLDAGHHGEMHYLARTDAVHKRSNPKAAWPGLESAVVLVQHYLADADEPEPDTSRGIIARYARGRDYHRVIKPKLIELIRAIEEMCGQALPLARAYVDTGPVLERELAQAAGLGWLGRNTMLIHPRRGSYFFLATVLLELDLGADAPFAADHCGSCHNCEHACPTGALLGRDADGAPVIDARRCISYLTIEHRGPIPRELRPLMGNRIFGCDICQEVCPWNGPKFVPLTRERVLAPRTEVANRRLTDLLQMSEAEWDVLSRGSAIRRAGYAGFRRNVAVALGNWGSAEAVPVLVQSLDDSEPIVRGHAAWALHRIAAAGGTATDDANAIRRALYHRLAVERDARVQGELRAEMLTESAVLDVGDAVIDGPD